METDRKWNSWWLDWKYEKWKMECNAVSFLRSYYFFLDHSKKLWHLTISRLIRAVFSDFYNSNWRLLMRKNDTGSKFQILKLQNLILYKNLPNQKNLQNHNLFRHFWWTVEMNFMVILLMSLILITLQAKKKRLKILTVVFKLILNWAW